jgi:hypothetical protein
MFIQQFLGKCRILRLQATSSTPFTPVCDTKARKCSGGLLLLCIGANNLSVVCKQLNLFDVGAFPNLQRTEMTAMKDLGMRVDEKKMGIRTQDMMRGELGFGQKAMH